MSHYPPHYPAMPRVYLWGVRGVIPPRISAFTPHISSHYPVSPVKPKRDVTPRTF
jgi:hypothetical protein